MDSREFEQLREATADVLGVDPMEITLETTFEGDLAADSLDLCQIVMSLEEVLDCKIDSQRARGVHTMRDALHLIRETLSEA